MCLSVPLVRCPCAGGHESFFLKRVCARAKADQAAGGPLNETSANLDVAVQRESFDEELAALPLEEREAYLKEFEEADRVGDHKKGGLIDRCEFV